MYFGHSEEQSYWIHSLIKSFLTQVSCTDMPVWTSSLADIALYSHVKWPCFNEVLDLLIALFCKAASCLRHEPCVSWCFAGKNREQRRSRPVKLQ